MNADQAANTVVKLLEEIRDRLSASAPISDDRGEDYRPLSFIAPDGPRETFIDDHMQFRHPLVGQKAPYGWRRVYVRKDGK